MSNNNQLKPKSPGLKKNRIGKLKYPEKFFQDEVESNLFKNKNHYEAYKQRNNREMIFDQLEIEKA